MSELQNYTLSSGKEIELRRVSIYTLELATKHLPQPKPPIDAATNEPNPAHPAFLDAYTTWQEAKQAARVEAIYSCGINDNIFDDTAKAEVADFRRFAAARKWEDPGPDDWLVYVKYLLLTSDTDFLNVQSLIMRGSLPVEEVISEAADAFKSGVEGRTDSGSVDATVGGDGRQS